MGLQENTPEAYAYTYLNFTRAAQQYGKTGGFPQLKTLLDRLPAVPFERFVELVEEEIERPVRRAFRWIAEDPLNLDLPENL